MRVRYVRKRLQARTSSAREVLTSTRHLPMLTTRQGKFVLKNTSCRLNQEICFRLNVRLGKTALTKGKTAGTSSIDFDDEPSGNSRSVIPF